MLGVLEEEQSAENEREDMMNKIEDPLERKRLEKIFGNILMIYISRSPQIYLYIFKLK